MVSVLAFAYMDIKVCVYKNESWEEENRSVYIVFP